MGSTSLCRSDFGSTPQSLNLSGQSYVDGPGSRRLHRRATTDQTVSREVKVNMQKHSYSVTIGGREITIESGSLANLAGGAVTVRSGDSLVLGTVCSAAPR